MVDQEIIKNIINVLKAKTALRLALSELTDERLALILFKRYGQSQTVKEIAVFFNISVSKVLKYLESYEKEFYQNRWLTNKLLKNPVPNVPR